MESYEYYLNLWQAQLKKLYEVVSSPDDVDTLQSEDDKKKFIISFRDLTKILTKLKNLCRL
jgi:Type I restriction and modification enzyme - subunit R C terminal.